MLTAAIGRGRTKRKRFFSKYKKTPTRSIRPIISSSVAKAVEEQTLEIKADGNPSSENSLDENPLDGSRLDENSLDEVLSNHSSEFPVSSSELLQSLPARANLAQVDLINDSRPFPVYDRRPLQLYDSCPLPLYKLTAGLQDLYDGIYRPQLPARCAFCHDEGLMVISTRSTQSKLLLYSENDDGNNSNNEDSWLQICQFCPRMAMFEGGRFRFVKEIGHGAFSSVFLVEDCYWRGRYEEQSHGLYFPSQLQVLKVLRRRGSMGLDGHLAENELRWRRIVGLPCRLILRKGFRALLLGPQLYPLEMAFDQYPLTLNPPQHSRRLIELIRRLILDVTRMLQRLHKARPEPVMHADIKMENILYDARNCCFHLVDYGSCVEKSRWEAYEGTFELGSWPYRSPEVVLGWTEGVGLAADCWALGIVVLILLREYFQNRHHASNFHSNVNVGGQIDNGKANLNGQINDYASFGCKFPFQPPRNPNNLEDRKKMVEEMVELLGPLPDLFSTGIFFPQSQSQLKIDDAIVEEKDWSLPLQSSFPQPTTNTSLLLASNFWYRWRRCNLARWSGCEKEGGLADLLAGLLDPDPKTRLTVDEILIHPWITNYNNNNDTPYDYGGSSGNVEAKPNRLFVNTAVITQTIR